MGFELYKKTRAVSDEETVSISSVGMITLSPACTEKYLKDLDFVQLFFDTSNRRVGIKPVKKGEKYCYRLIRTAHGRRAGISGRAFVKTYKILPIQEKDKFKPVSGIETKYENGMIVFAVK